MNASEDIFIFLTHSWLFKMADVYAIIEKARKTGKVEKGTNEVTKAIERGITSLVYVAEDVQPPEVVAHLPLLCEERKVSYIFVPSKTRLGQATGLDVGSAAACIVEAGDAAELVKEIALKVEALKKVGTA